MSRRFTQLLAVTGVSAALAVGGAGIAGASPNHGGGKRDDHSKNLTGKKKQQCIRNHEKHHGANHESAPW